MSALEFGWVFADLDGVDKSANEIEVTSAIQILQERVKLAPAAKEFPIQFCTEPIDTTRRLLQPNPQPLGELFNRRHRDDANLLLLEKPQQEFMPRIPGHRFHVGDGREFSRGLALADPQRGYKEAAAAPGAG